MKLLGRDVFVILALVRVIASILGLGRGATLTSGPANTAKPGAQTALCSEASAAPAKEPFDYFPDHCSDPIQGAHRDLPGLEKSRFLGDTRPESFAALAYAPTWRHV